MTRRINQLVYWYPEPAHSCNYLEIRILSIVEFSFTGEHCTVKPDRRSTFIRPGQGLAAKRRLRVNPLKASATQQDNEGPVINRPVGLTSCQARGRLPLLLRLSRRMQLPTTKRWLLVKVESAMAVLCGVLICVAPTAQKTCFVEPHVRGQFFIHI